MKKMSILLGVCFVLITAFPAWGGPADTDTVIANPPGVDVQQVNNLLSPIPNEKELVFLVIRAQPGDGWIKIIQRFPEEKTGIAPQTQRKLLPLVNGSSLFKNAFLFVPVLRMKTSSASVPSEVSQPFHEVPGTTGSEHEKKGETKAPVLSQMTLKKLGKLVINDITPFFIGVIICLVSAGIIIIFAIKATFQKRKPTKQLKVGNEASPSQTPKLETRTFPTKLEDFPTRAPLLDENCMCLLQVPVWSWNNKLWILSGIKRGGDWLEVACTHVGCDEVRFRDIRDLRQHFLKECSFPLPSPDFTGEEAKERIKEYRAEFSAHKKASSL